MSELVAAVDCGTNSVRLLICRQRDGRLSEVDRRLHITRLGQGVDATGAFHPEALARTLDAMADFGTQLDDLGVARRRVVATSAARDAANSAEFFDGVRARLKVDAECLHEVGMRVAWRVAQFNDPRAERLGLAVHETGQAHHARQVIHFRIAAESFSDGNLHGLE